MFEFRAIFHIFDDLKLNLMLTNDVKQNETKCRRFVFLLTSNFVVFSQLSQMIEI